MTNGSLCLRGPRSAAHVLGMGLLLMAVSARAVASPAGPDTPPPGARQALCLNGPWLVKFVEDGESGQMDWQRMALTAQTWQRVAAPQSWNLIPGRQEHKGVAWYRRTFHLPPGFRGRHVTLKFQCAAQDVNVWLNEADLGGHVAGFIPFSFDATSALQFHDANVLMVRCDNTPDHGPSEILPWGGLIGSVSLEATGKAYVADVRIHTDIAQQTAFAGQDTALVDAAVDVRNSGQEKVDGALLLYVGAAAEGAETSWRLTAKQDVSLEPDASPTHRFSFALDNPELWHFDRPFLYTLRVVLADAAGKPLDILLRKFGVRDVRVSGQRLLVNGEWVRLVGVGRFPDHPQAGATEPLGVVEADLAAVQEMNGVACSIRGAPPHPNLVAACDERGILLTASLPIWEPDPEKLKDAAVVERAKAVLAEMIRAYRGHPSIWSWSLGEGIPDDTPQGAKFIRALRDVAKQLDPTRPVTFTRAKHEPKAGQAAGELDYVSVRGFFGSQTKTSAIGDELDRIHAVWPDKMVVVSGWGWYNDGGATTETAVAKAVTRELDAIRSRPFVGALLWGALSHYRSPRERPEGYDKQKKVASVGLMTRERRPLRAYSHFGEAIAPIRIMGLAYRSDTFALGDELATMVGLKIASPVARSLPCYGLTSYSLRWSAAGATETLMLPPFRPDYFVQSPRSVAWKQIEWTPRQRGTSRLDVSVLRPTGRECARRKCHIQCRPREGRVQLDRLMVLLDLEAYFNCDAVSSNANRMAGNFDTPHLPSGASYPESELPESHAVIMAAKREASARAIPFLFPDKKASANNIACGGQTLIVPPGRYESVHFLGSAENGSFERNVRLIYADGSSQDKPWRMSDWCGPSHADEETVIRASFRHGWGGEIERDKPCYVRWQSISADPTRTLQQMRLPDHPHMHVFAITLEAE